MAYTATMLKKKIIHSRPPLIVSLKRIVKLLILHLELTTFLLIAIVKYK